MNLVKPLCFLLIPIVFLGSAMAGDAVVTATASAQVQMPASPSTEDAVWFPQQGKTDDTVRTWLREPEKRVEMSPFAGVCFTMRTYKVKSTERLQDNESGMKGYSTCQMGSDYRVRTAATPASK
jgi:hypothetical protein